MRTSFAPSVLSSASGGMSKLAAALAGGGRNVYEDAYDKEATIQSRMAHALAAIHASNAQADYDTARAEAERAKTGVLQRRPDLYEEQVANSAGLDIPTVRARREQLRTGVAPQVPMGPEAPDGSMGVGSLQLGPQSAPKLSLALQQFLPVLANSGDLKPDDLAKSAETFRAMGLGDEVLAGTRTPRQVGAAQAAVAGKPLFHSGENGAVLNLFTGGLDESGGLAQNNIKLLGAKQGSERALTAERQAGAAAHYASADNSRASAAKTRAEMEQGIKTGDIQLVTQEDGTVLLVNKRNGLARPAVGMDGKPVSGAGKPLTEGQGKATTYAARMQDADATIQQLEGNGIGGADLRTLAARNAWTNWMATPEGQQYRQAQENWVTANLRHESGAVIGKEEMDKEIRKYFPVVGDDPAVIAQKARSRQIAQRGMLQQAGPGAKQVPNIVQPGAGAAPPAAPTLPAGWGIQKVN